MNSFDNSWPTGKTHPFLLLLSILGFVLNAQAANSTWQGDSGNEWNFTQNWTAGVPGPGDAATFSTVAAGNSTTPVINLFFLTEVGTILFQNNAAPFQIQVSASDLNDPAPAFLFKIEGLGIVNTSGKPQSLSNNGGVGGVTGTGGQTQLVNGAFIIGGAGFTITNHQSPLGMAGSLSLQNTASLGNATLVNEGGGTSINGGGGFTIFNDSAKAGTAAITNGRGLQPGFTFFTDSTNAGNANITNQGGNNSGVKGGITQFGNTATLSNGTITNQGAINGGDGGKTTFFGSASAGNGEINTGGGFGNALSGGITQFTDSSTAGAAAITTSGGVFGGPGGLTLFQGNASASNAVLITNGGAFGSGGVTEFIGSASGGSATVVTNLDGTFDISGLTTGGTTVGSIAGAGSYVLGGKTLSVGSKNTSTIVSGVISGVGGSLTKVGVGTLTLSGANNYSGSTLIQGGRLIATNATGSATGSSGVSVSAGATLGGGNAAGTTGFVGGLVRVFNDGRIAPGGSGQPGKLTLQDDLLSSNTSQFNFQLLTANAFNDSGNDLLKIFGNLTLDGVLNLDSTLGFGGAGDYLLMTFGGDLNYNGLEIGIVPAGFNSSQFLIDVNEPGEVLLHVGVPEPSALSMMLVACALAGLGRLAAKLKHRTRRFISICSGGP